MTEAYSDRRRPAILRAFMCTATCAALLLAASSLSSAQAPAAGVEPAPTGWERIEDPASVGYRAEGLERVRRLVDDLATTGLMVVADGRVLHEQGDVTQVSYVASVRKSILAMLYGRHVENGDIDIDASLRQLGWSDPSGLLDVELDATVRHLITATSGVYHPASNPGDNTADAPERGSVAPGSYFLYNNWDFNTAGAVFERQTGRDVCDALHEQSVRSGSWRHGAMWWVWADDAVAEMRDAYTAAGAHRAVHHGRPATGHGHRTQDRRPAATLHVDGGKLAHRRGAARG